MATLTDYYNSQANKSLQQQLMDATLKVDTNAVNQVAQAGQQLYKAMGSPVSDNVKPQAPQAYDATNDINSLNAANKAALAAQLQKTRDTAVNSYNQKIGGLQQTYQSLRDSQDYQYNKAAKGTNESMANMGLNNSGDLITAQVGNSTSNQQALNGLNMQQQSDKTNLQNLIDQANNEFNLNLAYGNAQADANALNQLINARTGQYNTALGQYNNDRQFDYNAGQDQFNNGLNVANLTGYYNGQQTMQGALNNANLTNQNIVNQFLPQQLQGQITGQNLNNDYQKLINAGYPAEQAQKLALLVAQVKGQNLNNTNQQIQNQYLPQQLQADISAKNRSNTGGSGGSSSSSNSTKAKNDLFAEMQSYINDRDVPKAQALINDDSQAIIQAFGIDTYNKLVKMFWDWQTP